MTEQFADIQSYAVVCGSCGKMMEVLQESLLDEATCPSCGDAMVETRWRMCLDTVCCAECGNDRLEELEAQTINTAESDLDPQVGNIVFVCADGYGCRKEPPRQFGEEG